jgi:hypothetical protein
MLGFILGFLAASILWLVYIAYFSADAAAMGARLREWVKRKARK